MTQPLRWQLDDEGIDWAALSQLYRIAPLGDKDPADLQRAFSHSMFKCFVFDGAELVAVGRALADGVDCAYLCDVAVHPGYQSLGLGKAVIARLRELAAGHKKIILYANPGKEGFYRKLGFRRMLTAMAVFRDEERAIRTGLVGED